MAVPEGLVSYLWVVLTTVIAPGLFGAAITSWLGLRWCEGRRVFLAWSYLVGHYALAHVTYLWLATIQPVPGWVLPALALSAGGLLLWGRRRREPSARRTAPDWRMAAVGLLCALTVVDAGLFTNFELVTAGDEAEIWASKAKVMYTASGFDLRFGLGFQVRHPDYPLFNPLVQVLSFASCDRLLWFENRVPIQGFAIALLLIMSASLRRHAGALTASAALVAFVGSSFSHISTRAWSDVMLALGLYAAVDGWSRWRETGEPAYWRLSCVALAAMISAKNEGSMLAVVFCLAIAIGWLLQRRFDSLPADTRSMLWLLLPVSALLLFRWFNGHFEQHNDLFDAQIGGGLGMFERIAHYLPERTWSVIRFYIVGLLDPADGRLLILLMFAAAVVRGRGVMRRPELQILLLVSGALVAYMLVFVGTPRIFDWHLHTAARRTIFHVLPVAVLGMCVSLARLQKRSPLPPGDG